MPEGPARGSQSHPEWRHSLGRKRIDVVYEPERRNAGTTSARGGAREHVVDHRWRAPVALACRDHLFGERGRRAEHEVVAHTRECADRRARLPVADDVGFRGASVVLRGVLVGLETGAKTLVGDAATLRTGNADVMPAFEERRSDRTHRRRIAPTVPGDEQERQLSSSARSHSFAWP